MRAFFIALLLLHFFTPARTQNIDSLTRAADSSSKAIEETSQNFQRLQDSSYKLQMRQSLDQNSRNLDQFLSDMREREKREQRQIYIRIGFGVLFFAVLIFSWLRRRKRARQSR